MTDGVSMAHLRLWQRKPYCVLQCFPHKQRNDAESAFSVDSVVADDDDDDDDVIGQFASATETDDGDNECVAADGRIFVYDDDNDDDDGFDISAAAHARLCLFVVACLSQSFLLFV